VGEKLQMNCERLIHHHYENPLCGELQGGEKTICNIPLEIQSLLICHSNCKCAVLPLKHFDFRSKQQRLKCTNGKNMKMYVCAAPSGSSWVINTH